MSALRGTFIGFRVQGVRKRRPPLWWVSLILRDKKSGRLLQAFRFHIQIQFLFFRGFFRFVNGFFFGFAF
jgi:hypothetical protein